MANTKKNPTTCSTTEVIMKLDVGCGSNKRPGFIGMDISPNVGAEVVHDWEYFPWPFNSDSVGEINVSHVLEHTKDLIRFMEECYRILRVGGVMHVACPYHTSTGAWQDPTHTRAISEMTFHYFSKHWRDNNGLGHYPISCNFDFSYVHMVDQEWLSKPQHEIAFAIQHYFNVCRTINATLTKRAI